MAFIFVAGTVLFLQKDSDSKSEEYETLSFPENTTDTSGWEIYQNEHFGFEVKHPKGWVVKEYTKAQLQKENPSAFYPEAFLGQVVLDSLVPYFSLGINIYDESVDQTREREEKILSEELKAIKARRIKVNNTQGFWYPDESGEYYDFGAYFLGNAKSGYAIRYGISPKESNGTETEAYQKIVLSFKILQ